MRISDWSSDVCSSDLLPLVNLRHLLKLDDTSGTALRRGAKDSAGTKAAEAAQAAEAAEAAEAKAAEAKVKEAATAKASKLADDEDVFIVVAQIGNYSMGIIVDRVFDTEDIVVKRSEEHTSELQ